MKRIFFYIGLSALSIGAMYSCTDRLDEKLELYDTSGADYSNPDVAKSILVGSYSVFQNMGWEQIPLISVRGDDVNAGGMGDQPAFSDTDKFIYDSNFWMYNSLWKEWYQKILQITSQINELEKSRAAGVNAQLIDQYQSECRTLRAFLLLEVSRVFGDAILMESMDQTQLSWKSKDELMQWISTEMETIAPMLPQLRPNERTDLKGGVTRYTALAIKAMANLELKNYSAVAEATGEIINSNRFSLYSDYYQLFKIPGKLANENLMEIQYSDFGTPSGNSVNHDWGFYGPQLWTPAVENASDGWGFYEPSLKFIKFMLRRNESVRLETSVLFTNRGIQEIKKDAEFATLPSWISNTTRDGDVINDFSRAMFSSGKHYLPSKQLTPGRMQYGSNKNYIVIRYAEILLMYAEAVTRGGNATAGTAVDAVNLVRARAKLAPLSSVTSEQVMDEKFAELGLEWGIRYYDMVRLEKTDELSYDGRTFSMDKRFLPYPIGQLDFINQIKNK